ncbi:hypothetical protein AAA214_23330 [Parabacteroides goldsteinii]|uniref:hypothetical protein n=1 Tax=Parabacteroides goldsteinii TaxID=328812 RepID=UPI0032BFAE51
MPSIEFIIKANYKEVDEAYARIDALKDLVKGFKADSPEGISIIGDINKEQGKIEKLVEEIRKLKQEQALQAQDAINNVKAQEAALLKLAQQYKDLSEQINNYSNATPPAATATTKTPSETSSSQSQAAESAKEQSMAFEELNESLELVNGSLEDNIKRLLEEKDALSNIKKQLAELTKEQEKNGQISEEQKRIRLELSKAEIEHKQSISTLQRRINTDAKLDSAVSESMDQLSQSLGRMRSVYRSLTSEERNSPFGKSLLDNIQKLDSELKKLDASIGNHQRNVGNYSSALDNLSSAMDGALDAASALPGPIGAAASGIKTLTKASLAFIATPVGAALAAIVAALAVLSSWFTRTEEGQNALNVASAYFKQTLDSILDVVDDVGEWLFNAFTKPKEALQDLSDFLEDQVMVRLKSLGRMGEAIMKIFSRDYKQGFADLGNAWLEQITGIEDAGKKALKFAAETNKKAKEGSALAKRENELAIEQRKWLVERSELEAKINELRERSQDSSLTEKERLKASKEASALINQVYEKERKLAVESRDIIAETNKPPHSNAQAKDEEAKATAKINKLDAERAAKNRELLSQQKELNNQIKTKVENANRQKVQVANRIREIEEAQKKISEKEVEAELKIEQNKINAMEEGADKTLAQIQFNYQRQIAEVTKFGNELVKAQKDAEEKAWKAANPNWEKEGKIFEPTIKSISQLPQKELETLAKMLKSIEDLRDRQEQNFLESSLKKYQNYTTQRIKAEEEFDKDKAALEKQRTEQNGKEIDAALIQLEKDREKSIGKIKVDEIMNSEDWTTLFNDMESLSTKKVNELIDTISEQLKNAKLDPINLKAVTDQLDKAKEYVIGVNPFAQLVKYIKEYDAASSDVEKKKALTKALKSALEGADQLSQVFGSLDGMLQEIGVDIPALSGLSNVLGSIASIDFTKPASIITGALGAIGSVFSIGKKVKEMNAAARAEQQKFYDEVHKGEMEYQALLRERARLEQQLGETSISYNSRITAELDKQRKTIDAQVNTLMKQLQQESYISGVGYKHGTWFRKAKTWNEYESLMGKTYDEIEALYMSNKLDGKAKELFEELQKLKEEGAEIDQMLVDQAEAFREYLSGMTFDSLKESIKSAFEDGKFDIQDAADFTKQVFKKAILQALEAKVLEKALQPFLESFQSDAEAGTLFEPGKMDYYQEWIKRIGEEGNAFMDNLMKLPELSDLFKDADATRSAQAKGLASMSQDTGEKLDGKFTAGLIYLDKMTTSSYDIAGSIKDLTRQSYDGWKNVEAIKELSSDIKNINNRIADNTEDIGAILKTIRSDTKGMNEDVSYVRTNGLYVKR